MADSNEKEDAVLEFDDYASLSDRAMIEMVTKQLHALRDLANSNPAVTEETMEAIEDALEQYISDVTASEQADQTLAASAQALTRSADNLLSKLDLPDAKPILTGSSKAKGN